MHGALLGLENTVARNSGVGPADTRRTKNALGRLGLMRGDKFAGNEFPTEGMFKGLKSFQRMSGLREDGVMKPGGPTERLLANAGRRGAPLGFGGAVGISQHNRRSDVTRARRALTVTGHLVGGGDADMGLAIQSFQRDFNLTRDGVINPGGPTDRALGRVVSPAGAIVARRPKPAKRGLLDPIVPTTVPAQRFRPEIVNLLETPDEPEVARRNLLEPAGDVAAQDEESVPSAPRVSPLAPRSNEEARDTDRLIESRQRQSEAGGLGDADREEIGLLVLSLVPGIGEALSAKEAYEAGQAALAALENDRLGEFFGQGGVAILAGIGAIPVLGGSVRLGKAGVKAAALLYRKLLGRGGRQAGKAAGAARLPQGMALELPGGPKLKTGRDFDAREIEQLTGKLDKLTDPKVRKAADNLIDGGTLTTKRNSTGKIANIEKPGGSGAADAAFRRAVKDAGGTASEIVQDGDLLLFRTSGGTAFVRYFSTSDKASVVVQIPDGVGAGEAVRKKLFLLKVRFLERGQ